MTAGKFEVLFRADPRLVRTCFFALLVFCRSLPLLPSHFSLCLPRDCLSCEGKWKHKWAESALWLFLSYPPITMFFKKNLTER